MSNIHSLSVVVVTYCSGYLGLTIGTTVDKVRVLCAGKTAFYDPHPFTVYTLFLPNIVHFLLKKQIRRALMACTADMVADIVVWTVTFVLAVLICLLTLALFGIPKGFIDIDQATIYFLSINIWLLTLHETSKWAQAGREAGNGGVQNNCGLKDDPDFELVNSVDDKQDLEDLQDSMAETSTTKLKMG
jgi:hypothetical protein